MIPLLSLHTPKPSLFLTRFPPPLSPSFPRFKSPPHRTHHFPILFNKNSSPIKTFQINNNHHHHHHQEPFSLAVTNAPKLKSPTLSPSWTRRTSFVTVSKSVGIVVLNGSSDGDGGGGGGSGKSLYEAAFLVKSVVRDRAYLLIGERVYIAAAAVNARGVVLSDKGLPAFVVRNMLMGSKSESVVLPLVARIVQTPNAALNASNSEGADFLIYVLGLEKDFDVEMSSGFGNVNIPIFSLYASRGEAKVSMGASKFVNSRASGLVLSLEDLKLFSDDD